MKKVFLPFREARRFFRRALPALFTAAFLVIAAPGVPRRVKFAEAFPDEAIVSPLATQSSPRTGESIKGSGGFSKADLVSVKRAR
jgi:hypothetical protein